MASSVLAQDRNYVAPEAYIGSDIERPYLEPLSTPISVNDDAEYDYPQLCDTYSDPAAPSQDHSQLNDILLPSARFR